ncbi:hypothetical protein HDV00_011307 [Rhizophlyctis rosea]|nr:hypothetical protein HDV00_011307 [Rhizophlyctis rosea]
MMDKDELHLDEILAYIEPRWELMFERERMAYGFDHSYQKSCTKQTTFSGPKDVRKSVWEGLTRGQYWIKSGSEPRTFKLVAPEKIQGRRKRRLPQFEIVIDSPRPKRPPQQLPTWTDARGAWEVTSRDGPSTPEQALEATLRPHTRNWDPSADLYRTFEILDDLNKLWTKVDQFIWNAMDPATRVALGYKLSEDPSATGKEYKLLGEGAAKFISTYNIGQLLQPLNISPKTLQFLTERSRMHNLPDAFTKFYKERTDALTRQLRDKLGISLPPDMMADILDCKLRMSVAKINLVYPAVDSAVNVWERLSLTRSAVAEIGDGGAAKDGLLQWKKQEYKTYGVPGQREYEGLELVAQPAVQDASREILKKGIAWRFAAQVG